MFALSARRRVAAVALGAGLVAVPIASAVAPGANAAGGEACHISGSTGPLAPSIPVTGSNTGSYTFDGPGTCAGSTYTGAVQVHSTGTYSNIQCGTGTATGTATLKDPVTGATLIGPLGYSITFSGGQGVLTLTAGGTGAGPVSIVPNTGGCVTGPATSFSVNAVVAGVF